MAEIFGVVASALSVAALFNNCIDCFEYIQLGRHFSRDFQRCQLKLDIAKTRMGRWGQAVGINEDGRFATAAPDDKTGQLVRAVVEEIISLFQAIQKSSKRYEITATHGDLAVLADGDMMPVARGLHRRLADVARQRQQQTSLIKKARWALYDGKNLDKLVDNISEFIDELEKLVPAEMVRQQLVELEIEEVNDEPSLMALQEASDGTDTMLSKAVAHKIEVIAGKNYAKDIETDEQAKLRLGNEWSVAGLAAGNSFADGTTNATDSVKARGSSAVQIGNSYGSKGIFDN